MLALYNSSPKKIDNLEDETKFIKSITPVIEVKIRCSSLENNAIEFNYTSNATPLTNMIVALEFGLGTTSYLKPSLISMITLENSIESFCRTSVTLNSQEHNDNQKLYTEQTQYQGIWVGSDSIINTAQAFIYASSNWIVETYPENSKQSAYYSFILQFASLESKLKEQVDFIYDHKVWNFNREAELEALIEEIDRIKINTKKNN
ncbi:MAG: hypothetical protein AAGF26_07890, partial [Cyanobacteria bacterium P01_G01_bin.49]